VSVYHWACYFLVAICVNAVLQLHTNIFQIQ